MSKMLSRGITAAAALLCFATLPAMPALAGSSIGDEARTFGACPAPSAATRDAHYAELHITGLRSAKGRVTVDFYGNNPDDFLAKGKKIIKVHFPASTKMLIGCIKLPRAGHYAIAGYHDENNNHHFDRSWAGMPREGYTFSRDPDALIVPSYSDTAFEAKGRVTIVPLKYHYPS